MILALALTLKVLATYSIFSIPRAARIYKAGAIPIRYLAQNIDSIVREIIREATKGKKNHISNRAVLGCRISLPKRIYSLLCGEVFLLLRCLALFSSDTPVMHNRRKTKISKRSSEPPPTKNLKKSKTNSGVGFGNHTAKLVNVPSIIVVTKNNNHGEKARRVTAWTLQNPSRALLYLRLNTRKNKTCDAIVKRPYMCV